MLMVEHKHTRNVISRTRLSDSLILSRSPYRAHTHKHSHTHTHTHTHTHVHMQTLSSSLSLFVRPDIIKEINNSVCSKIKIPKPRPKAE
jgi:ABC-type Zn2+ transport system substrate-binding protein/surface adhesin